MKRMRLYQHSARCPIALRTFLDCNPSYWCFIPLHWHDAEHDNLVYLRETSNSDPEVTNIIRMGALDNQRVSRSMDSVPLPPAIYAFSYRQRQKQRVFFEQLLTLPSQQRPYSTVDLYQYAIIAMCKYQILINLYHYTIHCTYSFSCSST